MAELSGRTKRARKIVDYTKFADDLGDSPDDDFAEFTPSPTKHSHGKSSKTESRPSLDDKLFDRNLNLAMEMSASNTSSPLELGLNLEPDDAITLISSEVITPQVKKKRKLADDEDFRSYEEPTKTNKKKNNRKLATSKAKKDKKTAAPVGTCQEKRKACVNDEDADLKLALELSRAECDNSMQLDVLPLPVQTKPPIPIEGIVVINSIHKSPSPRLSPRPSPFGKSRRKVAVKAVEIQQSLQNSDTENNGNSKVESDDDFNLSGNDEPEYDEDTDFELDEEDDEKKTPKQKTILKETKTRNKKPSPTAKTLKTGTCSKSVRTPSGTSAIPKTPASCRDTSTPGTGSKTVNLGLSKSSTPTTSRSTFGGLNMKSPGLRVGLSKSHKIRSLHPNMNLKS